MSSDIGDLSFVSFVSCVSLVELELCVVFDGLCLVFDGACQKYLAGSSRIMSIQSHLNPTEASFGLMTQRQLVQAENPGENHWTIGCYGCQLCEFNRIFSTKLARTTFETTIEAIDNLYCTKSSRVR